MQELDLQITFKVENLIQGYCYNFLSYLYVNREWKRCVFDSCKEKYINSSVSDKKIRILISNTGVIMISTFSYLDLCLAMEHVISEFAYGRMEYYLVLSSEVKVSLLGSQKFSCDKYKFASYIEPGIALDGSNVTISFSSYEDQCELREIITVFEKEETESKKTEKSEKLEPFDPKETEDVNETIENPDTKEIEPETPIPKMTKTKSDLESEKYMVAALFVYSLSKLVEYM